MHAVRERLVEPQGASRWRRRTVVECTACVCAIAATILFYGGLPKVVFVNEVITMNLSKDTIAMEGIFCYRNPHPFPLSQGFSLPTPKGDGMDAPHAVSVIDLGSSTTGRPVLVPLRLFRDVPIFSMHFRARETKTLRVQYSQKYDGHVARYILTTTGSWKKPLQSARYILQLDGVALRESNYGLTRESHGRYAFERRQFMPTADWWIKVSG